MFLVSFALHADDDAAVGQGVREPADGGHDFWAPAGETDEARSYPDGPALKF